jgi:hypothetical protein
MPPDVEVNVTPLIADPKFCVSITDPEQLVDPDTPVIDCEQSGVPEKGSVTGPASACETAAASGTTTNAVLIINLFAFSM